MNITEDQFQEMLARTSANMRVESLQERPASQAPSASRGAAYTEPKALLPRPVAKVKAQMNKWEESYAGELEAMRLVGEIRWWWFEGFKLRLANRTYYTPDFAVMENDGRIRFVEVKGFLRDDANVKTKVAAEQFHHIRFSMIRKKRVKEGGGWEVMRDLNV